MGLQAFYATSITAQVNQTGSAAQIQDSPDAPDNDWIIATAPNDSGSFTLNYDPAGFPAENIRSNSDWRFAIFVRNSTGTREAIWGGTLHINGGNQVFTRVNIPAGTGIKQELIQSTPGGNPLVSLSIDMDWTRSGGSAAQRTGADFDSIEIILEFADVFDFSGGGVGRALGTATMDIAPEELGTAVGTGAGEGLATSNLIPPREMAGTAAGAGSGDATLTLVPPTELVAAGTGFGTGLGVMDQLPYDFPPAAGNGVGTGLASMQSVAPPPLLELDIIDPVSPGPIFGLYDIIAREGDPEIPFIRVTINPASEKDPLGYKATPITPEGDHSYTWSTSPYVGGFVDIDATIIFQGASAGQGITGFQVTGGWGVEELADNAPVNVEITAGAAVEMQGGGEGLGDGTATMDLIPPTEMAADGEGLGEGAAGFFTYDFAATSSGIGTGSGVMQTIYDLSGAANGIGTGSAIPDVIHDTDGAGTGVGTANGTMEVLLRMPAHGNGQGFGVGTFQIIEEMASDAVGVGTGIATLGLIEGIIWQDPATGVDNDPWNPTLWEVFVQTPASVNATATIQSNTNEMTNDPDPPAMDLPGGAADYLFARVDNELGPTKANSIVNATWQAFTGTSTVAWFADATAPQYGQGYTRVESQAGNNSPRSASHGSSNRMFLIEGQQYTILGWVRAIPGIVDARLRAITFEDNIGGSGSGAGQTTRATADGEWTLCFSEFTVPVGRPWVTIGSLHNNGADFDYHDVGPCSLLAGDLQHLQAVVPDISAAAVSTNTSPVAMNLVGDQWRLGASEVGVVNDADIVQLSDLGQVLANLQVADIIDSPLEQQDDFGSIWQVNGSVVQVDNGGAYHEAIHAAFPSIRLDVDLVAAITNPTVTSRQAVYISASGTVDINGVPNDAVRMTIEDPAGGNLEARIEKVIDHAVTPLHTFDISGFNFPVAITLARSGVAWAGQVDDGTTTLFEQGVDQDLQDIPDGVVWVNTYNFGQADFQWDNFILTLLPFVEMQGNGEGVGKGLAALTIFDLNMQGSGFGLGEGLGTMDSGTFFGANGLGLGTGTGTMEIVVIDLESAGVGVGTGLAVLSFPPREMVAAGLGVGTGFAIWDTGNWPGGGVKVPGGSADAIVAGGPADAVVDGGAADATPKGEATDANVVDGTATVEIPGDSASVEGP